MNKQLLRLKQRSNSDVLQVAESDDSNNLYVNVADGNIDVGTIDTIDEVTHVTDVDEVNNVTSVDTVDDVTEVHKAVLYGTDKAGDEFPVAVNDEGQLDIVRMQASDIVTNSYMTFNAAAAQDTTIFADITNTDNETYDKYNLYITNPLPNILTLSVRNNVANIAGITNNHEIYTVKIPAAPYTVPSSTAWASCFTSIGATITDESGDWEDVPGGADVPFTFTAVNDAIYFGHTANFRYVIPTVATAGVYDADFVWEYWNGAAWTVLTGVVSNVGTAAAPFKTAAVIGYKWNTPADWVVYDIPGSALSRFWIRCRCTRFGSVTIAPALSQGRYILSRDVMSHMYQIESMFNGSTTRLALSNDTVLTTTQAVPIFYTLKKY